MPSEDIDCSTGLVDRGPADDVGGRRALESAGGRRATVWDGVYTDAQAERATATFSQSCSNCHTLEPQGKGPLTGEKFWEGFTQKTVGELLTYVSTNMPNGRGGSLPASTYNDLVALILKSNGLPAGTVELAPDTVAGVQIIPKDGPGELPTNTLVRMIGCLARNGSDWVLTSATAPERVERIGGGRGGRQPSAWRPHHDAQVRPDAPRCLRRAAHVGERHPDWRGGRGRHQRLDREPRRRYLPLDGKVVGSLFPASIPKKKTPDPFFTATGRSPNSVISALSRPCELSVTPGQRRWSASRLFAGPLER